MSTTCDGVSTLSFMRSTNVVPPAMKRISALCWAVFDFEAVAIAPAASAGRLNSNVFICRAPSRRLAACPNLLNRGHNVGVRAAAADVAAHEFFDRCVVGSARLFQQRNRRHDLPRGAIAALITVAGHERRLHRMHGIRSAEAFDRGDLIAIM